MGYGVWGMGHGAWDIARGIGYRVQGLRWTFSLEKLAHLVSIQRIELFACPALEQVPVRHILVHPLLKLRPGAQHLDPADVCIANLALGELTPFVFPRQLSLSVGRLC